MKNSINVDISIPGDYSGIPSLALSEFHLLPIFFGKISDNPSKKKLTKPFLITLDEYLRRTLLPQNSGLAALTKAANQLLASQVVKKSWEAGTTQKSFLFTSLQIYRKKGKKAVEFLLSPYAQENYQWIKEAVLEEFVEETSEFFDSPSQRLYKELRRNYSLDFFHDSNFVLKIKGNREDFGHYFSELFSESEFEDVLAQACQEINRARFSVFFLDYQKEASPGDFTLTVHLAKEKLHWQDLRIVP